MTIFDQIIALAKKMASALSKDESQTDLENSDLFSKKGKEHIENDITQESKIHEHFIFASRLNSKKGWNNIKKEIQHSTKALMYWLSGVAATLVLIASISYILFIKDNGTPSPAIVDINIKIGTDKATLTLANGSDITLEKGQDYKAENLTSNGEELVYNATATTKSEIAYNYLTVPRGGQFFLKLSDGTKVWLNSESQLKYPIAFPKGEARRVVLVYGEAFFDVSPSTAHNGATFKVKVKVQDIEVLGTEFNIKAYKDEGSIYTTLVEGKVALSTAGRTDYLVLAPNEQSNLNLNTNNIEILPIDVYNEISWTKGVFSFKSKTLEEITKVLSRWYDVNVVFANEDLKNVQFNGVLGKEERIITLLETFTNANFINAYEIKDKTITLK